MHRILFTMLILLTGLLCNFNMAQAYEKEINSLSSTLTGNIAKAGKKTIAVVDFSDLQGNITELGRFIAEELSVNLTIEAKGYDVIDRNHLKSILAENKLSMLGLVDPNTVKKVGQLAGADALVTGTVTPFGDSIRVTCKVIATDTAKVIGAAKSDIAKTKAIDELLSKGIEPESGKRVSASDTAESGRLPMTSQQTVVVNDFMFEVQECKLSGRTITCSVTITNKVEDRDLYINYRSFFRGVTTTRMIDDSGNAYQAVDIQFGTDKNPYNAHSLMASSIMTKAVIKFEGISSNISKVSLLDLDCIYKDPSRGEVNFKGQLKNIPISR